MISPRRKYHSDGLGQTKNDWLCVNSKDLTEKISDISESPILLNADKPNLHFAA
jgi:hypothetical protein